MLFTISKTSTVYRCSRSRCSKYADTRPAIPEPMTATDFFDWPPMAMTDSMFFG